MKMEKISMFVGFLSKICLCQILILFLNFVQFKEDNLFKYFIEINFLKLL